MSTLTTAAVERYQPPILTDVEQTMLLGFLAGYRGFGGASRFRVG